ncbi:DUF6325 family protein [Monashia sp. NPDC004114]
MTGDEGRGSPARDTPDTTPDNAPDLDLVEYVVVALPELSSAVPVADALKRLVDTSQIRILDVVGVTSDLAGRVSVVEPEYLPGLRRLHGADGSGLGAAGLLSDDDIALACRGMPAGSSALIVVAEDRWAQQLADAARTSGGQILGGERIPRHRLEQSRRSHARFDLENEEV